MSLSDDPRWLSAAARFDQGLYFEAHEDFEALWRAASGQEAELLQALAQAAVALHHLSHGNTAGASYLYQRCASRLAGLTRSFPELDAPSFLKAFQARLESPSAPPPRLGR